MNRLAAATSPYLLQHKDNPVAWWPWGSEALAEAERTRKPILLSVGYAACHWCHVMAHESFEDPATAQVMNELFVNIKVDREERPDVDHIYMAALHALGEQGGWPLTMFLTPQGRAFWGGTYFPKESRFGRPAFVSVLRQIARIHAEEPERVAHNSRALQQALDRQSAGAAQVQAGTGSFGRAQLDQVGRQLISAFDAENGGLAGAPKFPNCTILELMWRHAVRNGDGAAKQCVLLSLERMARGGIHDHLGGGFSRYSVDARWLAPHFEKMLYDNAQLLELLALAAAETGSALLREAAFGIVRWLDREMTTPEGAFCASLDADSEGEEGRFYVWSRAEIIEVLGAEDGALFCAFYDVTEQGNWEHHNILNRLDTPEPDDAMAIRLATMREALLAVRARRVRPGLDDKVLADWNAMMIVALVRAAGLLDQPEWISKAERAYRFIAESMVRDGAVGHRSLGHSWRAGQLLHPGFASDHAAMARAALVLHEATAELRYQADATRWLALAEALYGDVATSVLAMTARDAEALVTRPAPTNDDAVPNANGLYAEALVRRALAAGDQATLEASDVILERLVAAAAAAPIGHASILNALDLRLRGASVITPLGAGQAATALRQAALALPYTERVVVALSDAAGLDADHPAATSALFGTDGEGLAALVCAGERCSLPITTPAELQQRVAEMTAGQRAR